MIVAMIDKDYISEIDGGDSTRTGTQWTDQQIKDYYAYQNMGEHIDISDIHTWTRTRFRLLDDDREVYYGGWLLNDDGCIVQMMVSSWGTYDAGAIHIEIKKDDKWVMEIA
jgi:hypothetical protein